jgi:hypothetical protein
MYQMLQKKFQCRHQWHTISARGQFQKTLPHGLELLPHCWEYHIKHPDMHENGLGLYKMLQIQF